MKPQKAVLLKTRENMIAQLLFAMCVAAGVGLFAKRIGFIRRNILQGQDVNRSDRATDRWKVMARVALGQHFLELIVVLCADCIVQRVPSCLANHDELIPKSRRVALLCSPALCQPAELPRQAVQSPSATLTSNMHTS